MNRGRQDNTYRSRGWKWRSIFPLYQQGASEVNTSNQLRVMMLLSTHAVADTQNLLRFLLGLGVPRSPGGVRLLRGFRGHGPHARWSEARNRRVPAGSRRQSRGGQISRPDVPYPVQ